MYLRPIELNDKVVDFGSYTLGYFTVTTGLNGNDHAMQYLIGASGPVVNNPYQIINQNGANGTDYSIQKLDNIARAYIFKRPSSGPGIYSDLIRYYSKAVLYSVNDPMYNMARPYLTQELTSNYYIFQKAIISVKINETILGNNQLVTTDTSSTLALDCTGSRGFETSFNISVYKRNGSKTWVLATANVDYVLTMTAQLTYTLNFNIQAEFRVSITGIGYTSYNNPFGSIPDQRTLITDNSDTVLFRVNTGVTPTVDNITLPQIAAIIQAEPDSDGGHTIVYSNKNFQVSPNILFDTGIWTVDSSPITPTDSDWLLEINNFVDVKLHVLDSNNNDVIPPQSGLSQQLVNIPNTASYTIKYITTIK